MSESASDIRRVAVALATAAILGAWTCAGTRASSQDILDVKDEIAEVEREAKERHEELQAKVNDIARTVQREAVEAAAFRAQVRAALRIRDGED